MGDSDDVIGAADRVGVADGAQDTAGIIENEVASESGSNTS